MINEGNTYDVERTEQDDVPLEDDVALAGRRHRRLHGCARLAMRLDSDVAAKDMAGGSSNRLAVNKKEKKENQTLRTSRRPRSHRHRLNPRTRTRN